MLSLGNQKGANKKETSDFLKGRGGKGNRIHRV